MSGGFKSIIYPVADHLNISRKNVFANSIQFKSDGSYARFDENEPTSESGGKGKVIELLKKKYRYKSLFMIGDGVTDLESWPPADGFIGFGGNVVREKVLKSSPWFIYNFKDLIDELEVY